MITKEKELTGYPSIDKPWLKYYSEKAINAPLPECTLYEYIYENNKDYLNQNALNYFGKKITYSELFANIEKAAKSFQSMGVKKGDIVTIMSMHTPETIYCIYALNRLGAVANMVYMTLSEKELLHEVKNTESKILVILNLAYEKVEKIRTELDVQSVVVISPADSMKFLMKTAYKLKTKSPKLQVGYLSYQDFISLGKPVSKVADAPYEKMAPAIIAHTSGTTGEPKGVMLSNYNLNAVAYQYSVSGMNLKKGEKFFNMLPPFIGFGVSVGMNVPLVLGLEEILWILPDKEKVAEGFVKTKPNHFVSGPAYLDDIMSYTDVDMSGLKNFGGGGESITIEKEKIVNEFLKTHGANVRYLTGYGMTEFGATVCTGMNHAYKSGTLGIPFPAVIIKIVDSETGNEMSYNQVGEMCFNSPNTMIGYYKNEKATKDIIRVHKDGKEWLHTGDLGMVDERAKD